VERLGLTMSATARWGGGKASAGSPGGAIYVISCAHEENVPSEMMKHAAAMTPAKTGLPDVLVHISGVLLALAGCR
jgi:hypothetical protein